jgi:hypothetical protein
MCVGIQAEEARIRQYGCPIRSLHTQKSPSWRESFSASGGAPEGGVEFAPYFGGGAGMNPSRLRPGSGLGLGFGAFFASFLPLSLLPMDASVPQIGVGWKERCWGSEHAMKDFAWFVAVSGNHAQCFFVST